MDLVHFEDPPRIQMLHYLHRAKSLTGGQSYFVDSYAAAEHLRHTNADAFDVLCRANVTFEYTNDGHSRHFERPTIELEDYGKSMYPLQLHQLVAYTLSQSKPSTIVRHSKVLYRCLTAIQ